MYVYLGQHSIANKITMTDQRDHQRNVKGFVF